MKEMHGMSVDPLTDIVVCCGQSEAFAATIFACIVSILVFLLIYENITYYICFPHQFLNDFIQFSACYVFLVCSVLDKGDEVILFDPSYETYDTCIRLAGGVPVS